jgi:mRNA interferase HigB
LFPFWEHAIFIRVRVISKKTLKEFWERPGNGDSEQALKSWFKEANAANWSSPNDIKLEYLSASVIGGNRIVFNIKGNKYRLVVLVQYKFKAIYIRFVGTHKEYDRIDARSI